MFTFSSVANKQQQFQITFTKLDCVWFSWLSVCVPYIDLTVIAIMVVLICAAGVLSQSKKSDQSIRKKNLAGEKRLGKMKELIKTKEVHKNRNSSTSTERFSTQLIFPTEESRMSRVQSTPNLQSIIEVETENGVQCKRDVNASCTSKIRRNSSVPNFKDLQEDSLLDKFDLFDTWAKDTSLFDAQDDMSRTFFGGSLKKKIMREEEEPFAITNKVVETLWGAETIDNSLSDQFGLKPNKYAALPSENFDSYSAFFSSPFPTPKKKTPKKKIIFKDIVNISIQEKLKKATKLNPTVKEFVPRTTPPPKSILEDSFVDVGSGIFMPSIGDSDNSSTASTPIDATTESSPFMSCTTGQKVKPSLVYCRYGENCLQINCPYSHTVSDDVFIQLVSPSSVLPASMLPVAPLDYFPEHTQRLIALGVFNERPIAPKYTIAVIPYAKTKKRLRKKSTKMKPKKSKSTDESIFPTSTCSKEDAQLIRGLIKNLSCLNNDDLVSPDVDSLSANEEERVSIVN